MSHDDIDTAPGEYGLESTRQNLSIQTNELICNYRTTFSAHPRSTKMTFEKHKILCSQIFFSVALAPRIVSDFVFEVIQNCFFSRSFIQSFAHLYYLVYFDPTIMCIPSSKASR